MIQYLCWKLRLQKHSDSPLWEMNTNRSVLISCTALNGSASHSFLPRSQNRAMLELMIHLWLAIKCFHCNGIRQEFEWAEEKPFQMLDFCCLLWKKKILLLKYGEPALTKKSINYLDKPLKLQCKTKLY